MEVTLWPLLSCVPAWEEIIAECSLFGGLQEPPMIVDAACTSLEYQAVEWFPGGDCRLQTPAGGEALLPTSLPALDLFLSSIWP